MFSSAKSTQSATGPASRGLQGTQPPPAHHHYRPKKIARGFENPPKPTFQSFPPNESGHLAVTPAMTALCADVQPRCISLQNFAFCAIADRLQSPTAHLGCRFVCTTSGFAQKKDTKPVGGRGISAFSDVFSFPPDFLRMPGIRKPALGGLSTKYC